MRTRTNLLLVIAALLVTLLVPFRSAAQTHTAPLELLRTGHIAVKVKINGQGPFRLILDTGSPLTFISTRTAQQLGLISPQKGKSTAFGGLTMGGQATLKSVSVGDTEVQNLNALILDHPIVEALGGLEGRLDGIIGFSFFARFHTTLDYLASQVTFVLVDYTPQDVMNGMMSRLFGGPPKARVIGPHSLWGMSVAKSPQDNGVLVTQIYPGSAASEGGLMVGDRIATLDDRWTDTLNDLYDASALVKTGEPIAVKVVRNGKELLLTVRPRTGL